MARYTNDPRFKLISSGVAAAMLLNGFIVMVVITIVSIANGRPSGIVPALALLCLVGIGSNGIVVWKHRAAFRPPVQPPAPEHVTAET